MLPQPPQNLAVAVLAAPHSTQNLGAAAVLVVVVAEGEGKLAVTDGGGERAGIEEVVVFVVEVLV